MISRCGRQDHGGQGTAHAFLTTRPPRAFHLEISETTRQASSDTFFGILSYEIPRYIEIHTSQFYCSHLFLSTIRRSFGYCCPNQTTAQSISRFLVKTSVIYLYISQLFNLDLKLALILRKISRTFDQSRSSTFSKKPTETPPKWTANWGCMLLSTSSRMPQMLHQERSFQHDILGSQTLN